MRAAVMAAIVALAAIPAGAEAHTAYSPVRVTLTVDASCKIETPARATRSTITANGAFALLPDCRPSVTPLVTFTNDSSEGAYIATIDF